MKTIVKIAWIVGVVFFAANVSWAQTYNELLANTSSGIDFADRLPPLAELQALAVENSPIFKVLDADVAIGEYKVKEEKRIWMKSLGIEGGANYGLYDNFIISQDLGVFESNMETTEQTRYYLGGYIKIPISSIIDKSNVKTAVAEKEKLRYQREVRIQELRQIIIMRYNNILREYRGMIIRSNSVESYRVQKLRADEDFKNGLINVYEYARLEDMMSKAVVELEEAKLNFSTAFQILEETVGVKIQLKE